MKAYVVELSEERSVEGVYATVREALAHTEEEEESGGWVREDFSITEWEGPKVLRQGWVKKGRWVWVLDEVKDGKFREICEPMEET